MSNRSMIEAVLKAGVIDANTLAQFKKFGAPIDPDAQVEEPKDLETAAAIIGDVLESEGYVVVRETDLQVFNQYVETSQKGMLHLAVVSDVEPSGLTTTDIEITYGKTKMGELIIAWHTESIEDLLTDGNSYLEAEGVRIFFNSVRELYFGNIKAFMVCSVSVREPIPTE